MQKVIKVGNTVIVVLNDGTVYQKDNVSEETFNYLVKASEEEVIKLMNPDYKEKMDNYNKITDVLSRVKNSKLLTLDNNVVYWKEVSQLSLPIELVESIIDAEENNDENLIETYKNFWTLMSLNPNEQCRLNLFWFLNRNGLVISKSGFFVAYRNADKTNEKNVFTDNRTHTFRIEIGKMVTMDRDKCDSNQDVTCSKGLHLGARTWLKENYFGNTGLVCLCNPADVVAVPHEDYYGKLRTCAYLPIDYAKFDNNGDVIAYNEASGFDCEYVPQVIYEGIMGTEKDSNYKINIPDIPGVSKKTISDNLLDLAYRCITNRNIN